MNKMQELSVCEEENFKNVFENHMTEVRNFIYYKVGDLEIAEDLAQESFVKVWENCKDVIFSKVKSFLFTVANRLFLNRVRHEKVKLSFQKANYSSSHSSIEENPHYQMEQSEFKHKLEDAISSLPENQREVFLMNRIDKMTYSEISETLNVGVKAIEKRMSIALKTLKEKVEELEMYKI